MMKFARRILLSVMVLFLLPFAIPFGLCVGICRVYRDIWTR